MEKQSRYEFLKNKFMFECPYLKKCCFCIPLRKSLLVIGYVKLLSACLLILFGIAPINCMLNPMGMDVVVMDIDTSMESPAIDVFVLIIVTLVIAVLLTNFAFSIVVIVAAHKKSLKSMKAYYYYTISYIIALTMLFILLIFYLIDNLRTRYWFKHPLFISTIIVYIIDACIHSYLAVLVRSAVYKFENDFNFRYERNVGEEPVCEMES